MATTTTKPVSLASHTCTHTYTHIHTHTYTYTIKDFYNVGEFVLLYLCKNAPYEADKKMGIPTALNEIKETMLNMKKTHSNTHTHRHTRRLCV